MTGWRDHAKRAALALTVLAAGGVPSWADDGHSYNLLSATEQGIAFTDAKASRTSDGFIVFSMLTVPPSGSTAYSFSQVEINCSSQMVATLALTHYSASGTPSQQTIDPTPKPVRPNTLGDALNRMVCQGQDPYPRSKAINDTAAAVSKAHDLLAAMKKSS